MRVTAIRGFMRTTRTGSRLALALGALSLVPLAHAQPSGPAGATALDTARSGELSASARRAVVVALARHLRSDYVFPDVGNRIAYAIATKLASGGYDKAITAPAFAEALTKDLREIGGDAHLGVRFDPEYQQDDTPQDSAQTRRMMARQGFGIAAVQRLPGNIGYLDIRGFGPTPLVADAYAAAMTLLSGTDALIVDLRRNGGGEPQSVAELASYFFAAHDLRHLNDIYTRADGRTQEYWSNPKVPVHFSGPVYVLTSHSTFSGGEEFAYDLQTQKRAILVGEVTGGGANPGDFVPLAQGFVAFIPNGRAINPVTKTNWEHVGVLPDVSAAASDAIKIAYAASLKDVIASSQDSRHRQNLSDILAKAERGEISLPGYSP